MKEKIDLNFWHLEKRKISEIKPNPRNPRVITEQSIKGVRNSLLKNGYVDKIAINTDNMICSGHARFLVLKDILDPDETIDCYVPSRTLTDKEVDAPEIKDEKPDNNTITLNLTNAEFEIVNEAINVARDNLEIDPNSKPIPVPIVAICKEFLALIDGKDSERGE